MCGIDVFLGDFVEEIGNHSAFFKINNSAISDPFCCTFIHIDTVYTCWYLEIIQSLFVIIISIVVNRIWVGYSAILISNIAFTGVTTYCINTAGIGITIDGSSWGATWWWR